MNEPSPVRFQLLFSKPRHRRVLATHRHVHHIHCVRRRGSISLAADGGIDWPHCPAALREGGYVDAFAAQKGDVARAGGAPCALPPPTCWTKTRLDYVMLSTAAARDLRVRRHSTMESDASDHFPVVCELVER